MMIDPDLERFHYVIEVPHPTGLILTTYWGAVWPPPMVIYHARRRWMLVAASVLTDADMRLLRRRRPAERMPIRTAYYRARSAVTPLECGHGLAFDGRCTVCMGVTCDGCDHTVHFGQCPACWCNTSIETKGRDS